MKKIIPMRYKYIISGGSGYYSVAYDSIRHIPDVCYHSSYLSGIDSWWERVIIRLAFNLRIGKYVRWVLKPIVFPKIFPHMFGSDEEIVFLFFECQFAVFNTDYLDYLRNSYPKVKLVLYMQDIVASLPYYDIEGYKKRFDLVLSYDQHDCEKYGLYYYPTPYSRIDISSLPKKEPVDIFFCGSAKNRLSPILEIYHKCKNNGLKVLFYVNGVPEEQQEAQDDILYNTPISYIENLAYVANSKCILEVMQANADGFTPRLWEAIFYNKHLITNNPVIQNTRFYNPQYIHLISKDIDILQWINEEVNYPEDVCDTKSPTHLIELLDGVFSGTVQLK